MWGNYWGTGTMMGQNWNANGGFFGFLGIATWIALFLFLVLGALFFWKGLTKRDRR